MSAHSLRSSKDTPRARATVYKVLAVLFATAPKPETTQTAVKSKTGKWWHMPTTEYYIVTTMKVLGPQATRWVTVETRH